jgi:hypothetical protein
MKMIKSLWVLSFLACFAVILLTYANMPISVNIGENSANSFTVSRNNYFYLATGLFLLLNIILNIAGKSIQFVPKEGIIIPNKKKWLTNVNTVKELFFLVKAWTRGLALILNLFLCTFYAIIYNQNSEGNFMLGWTLYMIAGMITAWFLYFFVLFFSNPANLKKELSGK